MTTLEAMTAARAPWTAPRLADWYPDGPRLREGMEQQHSWLADTESGAAFGAEFRDGMRTIAPFPVDDPMLWANRTLDLGDGQWAVTGVRFRGRDPQRCFVDLVATTLPPTAETIARVADAVRPAYAGFGPQLLRADVPAPDELAAAVPGAEVDQYVVAGLVADLRERDRLPGTEAMRLVPCAPETAEPLVAGLYAELLSERPDLLEWALPATRDELGDYAGEGLLFDIEVDGRRAGVVAAFRDDGHAMTGFQVGEIVLDAQHRGRGLGSAALQLLCDALPADPGDTLWGTIEAGNLPSRRNAARIGREVVGGYVWFPL